VKAGRILGALGAVLFAATFLVVTRFDVSTDITNLMPAGSDVSLVAVSRGLTTTPLARTMILTIGAADPARAVAGARELAAKLRANPAVEAVRSGAEEDVSRAAYDLYFPRRYAFFSDDPARIPELLSEPALEARAEAARRELAQPSGMLTKRLLPEDPIGAFPRIVARLASLGPSLVPWDDTDGQLVTLDHRFAVLFVTTRASAFEGRAQRLFLADLAATFAGLDANRDGALELEAAGANRFAVAAERSIRADVAFVSLLTVGGVVCLFLVAFRSLRSLALVGLPIVTGIAVATCTSLLVMGRLDGITLGFGAALVGVVIDYPVHLLAHARLEQKTADDRSWLPRVRPGIVLGAFTTVASFVGLGITSIPGLQQLAFFAVVGCLAALAVTLFVLPPLLGAPSPSAHWMERGGDALGRWMEALAAHRRLFVPTAVASAALAAALLPHLRWQDDLSTLWRMDPSLLAEEQQVRARVGQADDAGLVVVLASDAETALARNDTVARRLEEARAQGALEGFRSLHDLLFAPSLQQENERLVRSTPDLVGRVRRAYVAAGFRPEAFAPFEQALASPPLPPLTLDGLVASPLGSLARTLFVPLEKGIALLTQVRGVHDEAAVRAALAGVPGVHLFQQRRFLNEVFAEFRTTTLSQVAVGYVLVLVLVALRYRRVRPALAAVVPSLFVTLIELGLFSLLGVETNLLHVVSLDMVAGMGVDYSVFVVDAARSRQPLDATMVGLVLCCLTTVFTFGVLSLSVHPALRAVGTTVGLGVLLSLLTAPIALLVLGPKGRPSREGASEG
jgi:predicted exporter